MAATKVDIVLGTVAEQQKKVYEPQSRLPLEKQWLYALGQFGWSSLTNLVGLQLVYFYLPPKDADTGEPMFTVHVSQAPYLVVLNIITLLATAGRVWDAVTDPIIASWSDRCNHRWGRRIPFLAVGALPSAVTCVLLFVPPVPGESMWNVLWLAVMQALFYLFITIYVTPYFSLVAELGHTAQERLNLSTWMSITFALGTVFAASAPSIGLLLGFDGCRCLQAGVSVVCGVGLIFMYVPVFFIDERRYCRAEPSHINVFTALRRCLRNPYFRPYVAADFSYWFGTAIITTGMPYFVTVLVQVEEQYLLAVVASIVALSFCLYYPTNLVASKYGKKPVVIVALLALNVVFVSIFFLGWLPLPGLVQIYMLGIMAAIPLAVLGVLPNAILADIAKYDATRTGENQEGMYFAARALLSKVGQSCGVMIFASLTNLGKDVGDDLGIRLSGPVGLFFGLLTVVIFCFYRESEVLAELAEGDELMKHAHQVRQAMPPGLRAIATVVPDEEVWGEQPIPPLSPCYPVASRGVQGHDVFPK